MFKRFVKILMSVTLCIVLMMSVMSVLAETTEQTYSISDLAGK